MSRRKMVLITGCSKGLGRAMVDGFVGLDWTVVGCARSAEVVEAMVASLSTEGAGHRFYVCDVADEESVRGFAESVLGEVGVPDLLVNNAALINGNAPLWEVSAEEFSRVVDVNVKGVASVCRAFLPAMVARGTGVVVNFSSGWGRSTSPEVAPYCATKFAVEGMTGALAQELPPGMAAVALNPGIIDTEMLQSCFGAGAAGHEGPEEWARRAVPMLAGLGAGDGGSLSV